MRRMRSLIYEAVGTAAVLFLLGSALLGARLLVHPSSMTLSSRHPAVVHTASAFPTCENGQMQLSFRPGPLTMGHAYGIYAFKNVGVSACSIEGFPRFARRDTNGNARPVLRIHQVGGPPALVIVPPGGEASFYVDFLQCAFDPRVNTRIPTITEVTPPGATSPLSLTSPTSTYCRNEDIEVSAISPGIVQVPGLVKYSVVHRAPPSTWVFHRPTSSSGP
jgi:hypothetical protein